MTRLRRVRWELSFWLGFWSARHIRAEPWRAALYDRLWAWGHRPSWLMRWPWLLRLESRARCCVWPYEMALKLMREGGTR